MTSQLLVPVVLGLLLWIGAGFGRGRKWLERRSGLLDHFGNEVAEQDI
jgi:hypothetical protein